MVAYIGRRLLGLVVSLWAATTLAFFALYLVPGDPAEAALSQSTAPADVLERRREALGLDRPLGEQYWSYIGNLLNGDLGLSWATGERVGVLVAAQWQPTVALALGGLTVSVVIGLALGLAAGLGGATWLGEASRSITGVLLAVPVMLSGTMLIWIFAIKLPMLPATGQGSLSQLVLPSLALGLSTGGGVAQTVEAGVSEALRRPFLRLAHAKGLTRWQAAIRHALRVGLLPTLEIVALQFGFLLGGTVVTEAVFARQGLGRLLLFSVLDKDLPVVQGIVILSALVYGLLNFGADVAKAVLDPRLREGAL